MPVRNPFALLSFLLALVAAACGPAQDSYLEEARTKLDEGRYREALSLLDESLKHRPGQHAALNARGAAYFGLGENTKALADFDRALALHPDDYRYHYNRGNAHRALGKNTEAEQDYTEALARDSSHYEVWLNRALTRTAAKPLEALQDFNEAMRLSGGKDKALFLYRGKALLLLEMFEEGKNDLAHYIELDPGLAEAYYHLAAAFFGLEGRESPEACSLLAKAVELGSAPALEMQERFCQ